SGRSPLRPRAAPCRVRWRRPGRCGRRGTRSDRRARRARCAGSRRRAPRPRRRETRAPAPPSRPDPSFHSNREAPAAAGRGGLRQPRDLASLELRLALLDVGVEPFLGVLALEELLLQLALDRERLLEADL